MATTPLVATLSAACAPGITCGSTVYWAPYHCGIRRVSAKLATPTRISGEIARIGLGRSVVSTRSGSFSSEVP